MMLSKEKLTVHRDERKDTFHLNLYSPEVRTYALGIADFRKYS